MNKTILRIGVTGYSAQKFDIDTARYMLDGAINYLKMQYGAEQVDVVSGLTDLGVPSVAYKLAAKYGWDTTGVACQKAMDYKLYPVKNKYVIGTEWGDETPVFLRSCDVLIRVGGGKQAKAEAELAKQQGMPTMEFELPAQEEKK